MKVKINSSFTLILTYRRKLMIYVIERVIPNFIEVIELILILIIIEYDYICII